MTESVRFIDPKDADTLAPEEFMRRRRTAEFVGKDESRHSMRMEWIYTLMAHYREVFPNAPTECYRRWAEGILDKHLYEMGDYLSA